MPPYAMPLTPMQMGSLGSMSGMTLPGSPGHGMVPMYPNPFGYYQPMPYHPMQYYPYDPNVMPLGMSLLIWLSNPCRCAQSLCCMFVQVIPTGGLLVLRV